MGFRRKKYLVKCDGKGSFNFNKIQSIEEALNELSELRKKRIITEKEFSKAKEELGL